MADGGVSSKSHGVLIDGDLRRSGTKGILNVQNSSPLSETSTRLIVLGASDIKVVDALSDTFAIGSVQRLDSLVNLWVPLNSIQSYTHQHYLDARNDALLLQGINEWDSLIILLVEGLLKENHPRDVLLNAVGVEEELTVLASVLLRVLYTNRSKSLSDGSSAFISSKDAFARRGDGLGGGDKFSGVWRAHGGLLLP